MIICDKKIVRIPLGDETLTIRSNRSDGYASIVARSWLFDWMICWLWDNLRLGGLVMCCEVYRKAFLGRVDSHSSIHVDSVEIESSKD
ncbi:hypothetical protein Tco_0621115 [Tanacetum coccineum]